MPARGAVKIRTFRAGDLQRVLALERATFPEGPYTRGMFRELHRDCGGLFFVAVRWRRIVGYMVTGADKTQAEIVSIGVDPACQKRGVGTQLMEHTLAALEKRGIRRMQLTVRTSNRGGVRFYRRFGFRSAGRIHRYYEDGCDAFRMKRSQPAKGTIASRTASVKKMGSRLATL